MAASHLCILHLSLRLKFHCSSNSCILGLLEMKHELLQMEHTTPTKRYIEKGYYKYITFSLSGFGQSTQNYLGRGNLLNIKTREGKGAMKGILKELFHLVFVVLKSVNSWNHKEELEWLETAQIKNADEDFQTHLSSLPSLR